MGLCLSEPKEPHNKTSQPSGDVPAKERNVDDPHLSQDDTSSPAATGPQKEECKHPRVPPGRASNEDGQLGVCEGRESDTSTRFLKNVERLAHSSPIDVISNEQKAGFSAEEETGYQGGLSADPSKRDTASPPCGMIPPSAEPLPPASQSRSPEVDTKENYSPLSPLHLPRPRSPSDTFLLPPPSSPQDTAVTTLYTPVSYSVVSSEEKGEHSLYSFPASAPPFSDAKRPAALPSQAHESSDAPRPPYPVRHPTALNGKKSKKKEVDWHNREVRERSSSSSSHSPPVTRSSSEHSSVEEKAPTRRRVSLTEGQKKEVVEQTSVSAAFASPLSPSITHISRFTTTGPAMEKEKKRTKRGKSKERTGVQVPSRRKRKSTKPPNSGTKRLAHDHPPRPSQDEEGSTPPTTCTTVPTPLVQRPTPMLTPIQTSFPAGPPKEHQHVRSPRVEEPVEEEYATGVPQQGTPLLSSPLPSLMDKLRLLLLPYPTPAAESTDTADGRTRTARGGRPSWYTAYPSGVPLTDEDEEGDTDEDAQERGSGVSEDTDTVHPEVNSAYFYTPASTEWSATPTATVLESPCPPSGVSSLASLSVSPPRSLTEDMPRTTASVSSPVFPPTAMPITDDLVPSVPRPFTSPHYPSGASPFVAATSSSLHTPVMPTTNTTPSLSRASSITVTRTRNNTITTAVEETEVPLQGRPRPRIPPVRPGPPSRTTSPLVALSFPASASAGTFHSSSTQPTSTVDESDYYSCASQVAECQKGEEVLPPQAGTTTKKSQSREERDLWASGIQRQPTSTPSSSMFAKANATSKSRRGPAGRRSITSSSTTSSSASPIPPTPRAMPHLQKSLTSFRSTAKPSSATATRRRGSLHSSTSSHSSGREGSERRGSTLVSNVKGEVEHREHSTSTKRPEEARDRWSGSSKPKAHSRMDASSTTSTSVSSCRGTPTGKHGEVPVPLSSTTPDSFPLASTGRLNPSLKRRPVVTLLSGEDTTERSGMHSKRRGEEEDEDGMEWSRRNSSVHPQRSMESGGEPSLLSVSSSFSVSPPAVNAGPRAQRRRRPRLEDSAQSLEGNPPLSRSQPYSHVIGERSSVYSSMVHSSGFYSCRSSTASNSPSVDATVLETDVLPSGRQEAVSHHPPLSHGRAWPSSVSPSPTTTRLTRQHRMRYPNEEELEEESRSVVESRVHSEYYYSIASSVRDGGTHTSVSSPRSLAPVDEDIEPKTSRSILSHYSSSSAGSSALQESNDVHYSPPLPYYYQHGSAPPPHLIRASPTGTPVSSPLLPSSASNALHTGSSGDMAHRFSSVSGERTGTSSSFLYASSYSSPMPPPTRMEAGTPKSGTILTPAKTSRPSIPLRPPTSSSLEVSSVEERTTNTADEDLPVLPSQEEEVDATTTSVTYSSILERAESSRDDPPRRTRGGNTVVMTALMERGSDSKASSRESNREGRPYRKSKVTPHSGEGALRVSRDSSTHSGRKDGSEHSAGMDKKRRTSWTASVFSYLQSKGKAGVAGTGKRRRPLGTLGIKGNLHADLALVDTSSSPLRLEGADKHR